MEPNLIHNEDKSTFAYEEIKKIIVRSQLSASIPLSEAYFVSRLNISRTPIRAALQRLQHEGFLRIVPKQGIMIRELGFDEAFQLLEMRYVVERYLISRSVGTLDRKDFDHLYELIEQQKQVAVAQDYEQYLELDERFHDYCYHHYKNKFMTDFLQNFRERFYSNRFRALMAPGRLEQSIREHEQFIETARRNDFDTASRLLETHTLQMRRLMENKISADNI